MTILIFRTLLLLLLLGLSGAGIVVWFVSHLRLNFLLAIGFSFLVGIGVYSAIVTTLLLKGGFAYADQVAWGLGVLGLLSVLAALYRKRWSVVQQLAPTRATLALLVLSLVIVAPVAVHSVLYPLTAWDAKMIWMVKAKALYVEPHVPNTFFDEEVFASAHKDYPLGFPALVAAHYEWYGGVSEQPVALTYVAFWWVILVLVAGGVARVIGSGRSGKVFGIGAGLIVILSAADPLFFAGLGLADLPLAAYFLAATTAVLFATNTALDQGQHSRMSRWLWLVLGLMSALIAANFKNEGQSFVLLYVLVSLAVLFFSRNAAKPSATAPATNPGRSVLSYLTAALPVLAITALPLLLWHTTKTVLHYKNNAFVLANRSIQFYMERVIEISQWFIQEIPHAGHWGWALLPMVLLAAGACVWWLHERHPRIGLAALALIAGQVAVYFLVYVFSPHDLNWHIPNSIDRVFLQVVPAFYLVVTCLTLQLLWPKKSKQVYSTN